MGKVRSIEHEEGVTTRYIQESDGKLTINKQQNVNKLMKRNKELYNHDDGYLSKEREMKRVMKNKTNMDGGTLSKNKNIGKLSKKLIWMVVHSK